MKRILGATAGIVGAWALWRLFGPDARPTFAPGQERPLQVPGRTVFVNGAELFVREIGPPDAPALVLLHGAGYDGEATFHRVIPQLAERHRLIVPDHRAHGKSDRTRGPVTMAELADDLAGVLDALDIRRVAVFGYSMGGMVALRFTVRYPERVSALILGATAAYPFAAVRSALPAAMWLARGFTRLSLTEQVLVNYRHLIRTRSIEPTHGRWMWNVLMSRDAALYWEAARAIGRFDGRQATAGTASPTLLLFTTRDQMFSQRSQRDLAGLVPHGRVVEIDAGHEAIFTHAADIAGEVEAFLGDGIADST